MVMIIKQSLTKINIKLNKYMLNMYNIYPFVRQCCGAMVVIPGGGFPSLWCTVYIQMCLLL